MAEDDDVYIPFSIEPIELALDPLILLLVISLIRIERHDERVSVAKRVRCVTREPMLGSLGRD
jgi:hypothetical protein